MSTRGGKTKVKTTVNTEIKLISELLTVAEFAQLIEEKSVQLIDVRTASEFNDGAIKNSINIDYYEDNFKENMLQLDKNKPLAIYCRSGGRSGKAAKMLKELGFMEVYDLKGGYLSWSSNK